VEIKVKGKIAGYFKQNLYSGTIDNRSTLSYCFLESDMKIEIKLRAERLSG